MKRAIVTMLAVALLLPTGATARADGPWSRVRSMVPATLDTACEDYRAREISTLVGPAAAGVQCEYLGPEKVNDFSFFLFDEEWGLRDLWAQRKKKRVANATGDCADNRAGVVKTARGELICYKSGGKARLRWIDEEHLVYGALDTDWGRLDYAYDWWQQNLEPLPPGAILLSRPWELQADDPITIAHQPANQAFGGFRQTLIDALAETRAWLAAAPEWIDDPDWYLVRTPDSGTVAVRLSRLADHAALLADPGFAARADVLDEPVNAWDDEFTMALGLISDEAGADGDPVAAAERLLTALPQTSDEKRQLLGVERKGMRAYRDQLIAAIEEYDVVLAAIGIEPAAVAAADVQPASTAQPIDPIDLVMAFRDELVADRVALQERILACREAIDSETVAAYGAADGVDGVATIDLQTWPGYAYFFEFLRERGVGWAAFEPAVADGTSLRAALARFQRWQDWPPGMMRSFADEQVASGFDVPTTKEDRAICRPRIQLLQPERDRLDAAIASLDEYLMLLALDAEPTLAPTATPTSAPTPRPTPEPTLEPEPTPTAEPTLEPEPTPTAEPTLEPTDTPAPNPFADL